MLSDKEQIKSALSTVINELEAMTHGGLTVMRMPDGSIDVMNDAYAVLSVLSRAPESQSIIRSIIIDACKKSEIVAPTSSKHLIRLLKNSITSELSTASIIKSYDELLHMIDEFSCSTTSVALKERLRSTVPNVAGMLEEAIALAGSDCKIFIEPSTTGTNTVELLMGHMFNIGANASFLKNGRWFASDVKLALIDGTIENVSEIDHMLQRSHELKRPMVIMARGFSRDVISTLNVNYARKTLNVVPVVVEFGLETANVLIDVAMVAGCDVVSSLKGDVISQIKYDELPTVQNVTCTGSTTIISSSSTNGIKQHLQNLIQRRIDEQIPALRMILDKRVRSLTGASVVIRVSDAGSLGSKMMHDLDIGLKVIRSMLKYGVVQRQRISGYDISLLDGILEDESSAIIIGSAIHYATSIMKSFDGASLCLDKTMFF
jgi:chaperonin GroEL (HSP60 family)